jgi:N-acetyl sugar amidotransferase
LYPANHPLGITFDIDGVCSGCKVHEEKSTLDWVDRKEKLRVLLETYRNKPKSNWDCVVPVSGGRDSYFIVHVLKSVFKLNPILVSYNKHYNTRLGNRNLAYLKTIFDCDIITQTLSPDLLKRITRYTLKAFGSMYWHCIAGEKIFPIQIAARFKIPLIIWGVHQGIDQVGMFSHLDEVEMSRKYIKEHDLMGYEPFDLINEESGLSESDMAAFAYPHDKEIESVGLRGIYLGNYLPWDTKLQHELMIRLYGYETGKQQRTFDTYNDVDSFHYSGVHDYIKFLKYGYGKVTDHACREIRWQRMTREEGINLVKQYTNILPDDLAIFLRWLQIDETTFFRWINTHRNSRIWNQNDNGEWHLLDSVINHLEDIGVEKVRLTQTDNCKFLVTPSKKPDITEKEYVLFEKGVVSVKSMK